MEAARARGVHLGRPRKLTDKQCAMIETLLRNRHRGQTARQIAEQFGVDRTTMYRALREHALARPGSESAVSSPRRDSKKR
ncbi:helix-turn-helix domain-containing protein [Azospirillum himalayense]|uniref:Helix-turn-helix domain-containing protein n=1 Tax=Azospirillum himalayense TaxID=654847 RepID=A0ABW0GIZ5_9PROT